MARSAHGVKVSHTVIGGGGVRPATGVADPVNTATTTAVAAAIAVLVADGASPTQAHVNTLNSAWTTLLAGTAAIPTLTDVIVTYDPALVGSVSNLEEAFRRILASVRSTNDFAH